MSNEKLEFCVKRFKAGDKESFNYIYDATYKPAYFSVLYIMCNKRAAEDVLHDAYLKAMQNIDKYKEGTNFVAWLSTIARNTAINELKKSKREVLTDFNEESYRYGVAETEVPYVFELAAKHLPEDEYQVVMLCQVAGYKRREVAEMLNMPVATVTWKNNKALATLKEILERD